MEQSNQEEILRNYVERVVSLQNQRRRALMIDDLKGIARELGMSDEDMIAADQAVEAHIERGLRHGAHGRWSDAIAELTEAVAMNPANLRALFGLAVAHKERWMSAGSDDDRRSAERLARQILQLYPDHDPAYILLNDIEPRKKVLPVQPRTRKAPSQRWLLTIPVLFGIAILGWLFFRPFSPADPPVPVVLQDDTGIASGSGPAPASAASELTDGASGADIGLIGHGIPIVWECTQGEGIGLELRETFNEVTTTRKLQLLIDNTGDLPLHGLEIRIDDYDQYGLKTGSNQLRILTDEDAPIASGMFRTTYLEYPVSGFPATYKISIVAAR